jgi:glycosyltransferase involved in cell wall biosynthesis
VRILLLTQVVPNPPDSGPKIKTHHVLRYLAERHEVHLVSFTRSPAEVAQAEALRAYCATVTAVPLQRSRRADATALARSLLNGRPFLIERDDRRAMRRAVAERCRWGAFDAVHADQLSMGQFACGLPVRQRVFDAHNAVWTIVRRAAAYDSPIRRPLAELEWRKLRCYEGTLVRSFDWVTVVSGEDQRALEDAAGGAIRAQVIPIAIDSQTLAFVPPAPEARHVLSVATMFYPPNVEGTQWFAQQVFPRIRQALPGTRFNVVGSRPPERIIRLAGGASGIVVHGYVADLTPLLRESGVLVVPLHSGSGMRVKILEAFSRGLPVVSTTIGAEGIDARPGEHLLVADDPADFAAAVVRLLSEPVTAARLAHAGRTLVEERYDWRTALRGLDQIYGVPVGEVR